MKLTITTEAEQQLKQLMNTNHKLLLWYDREDCGCGVNGIPTLRFIQEKQDSYKTVESNSISTYIEEQQAVFFSEDMKLDSINNVFRLSSKEGILTPFIVPASIQSV